MTLDELLALVPGCRRFRHLNAATLRILLDRKRGECTWCGNAIGRGRSTWCGDQCVKQFELRCTSKVIGFIEKRDQWICQICGRDTKAAEQEFRVWLSTGTAKLFGPDGQADAKKRELGYGRYEWRAVDHIVPVSQYGGLCGPDNLRLLCGKCHLEETNRVVHRKKDVCK